MAQTRPQVTIYCDGGSSPNPGPGGWGALLLFEDGSERELSGGDPATTNNQMELTAAISALEALETPHTVTMFVDSQYVQKGMTEWMRGWLKKNWVNSKGEPVANQELWQRLLAAARPHKVTWRWVRGHAGNINNERVDQLATQARARLNRPSR